MLKRTALCLAIGLPACGGGSAPQEDDSSSGGPTEGGETSTADSTADESGNGTGPGEPGDPVALRCPDNPEGQDPLILIGEGPSNTAELAALVATDQHAFACSPIGGLAIWSLADPTAPALVHGPDGDGCTALAVDADQLAVARDGRVELLSVTDPSAPSAIAEGPLAAPLHDLVLDADAGLIRVAAGTAGLVTLSSSGGALTETGRFVDMNSDARALAWSDSQLVVAEAAQGVRLYDATPASFALLDELPLEGVVLDVAIADELAWVTTLEGAAAVEVGDATLDEGGTVSTPGSAIGVAVGEGFIVVADWNAVVGIDPSSPATPTVVTSESLPTTHERPRAQAVAVTPAGRVLVAGWQDLLVYGPACTVAAPAVAADPPYLPFHATEDMATQQTRVVSIRNRGNRDLHVAELITPAGMSVDEPGPFVVAPGSAEAVEVNFNPGAGAGGDVVVVSDDPDQPQLVLEVDAGISGVVPGQAPVPLRALDLEGRVWNEDDMAGQVVLLAYFATW